MAGPPTQELGRINAPFTLQEQALCTGMLTGARATINYGLENGSRRHRNPDFTLQDYDKLVSSFKRDPFSRLAYARQNLLAIMTDTRLPQGERIERLNRYTDAYLKLIVRLDRKAFPADDVVRKGIPEYVMDGLSDMGGDDELHPQYRNRERIRVNKKEIFKRARPLIDSVLSAPIGPGVTREQWKIWATHKVAHYVFTAMPYNEKHMKMPRVFNLGGESVGVEHIFDKKLAACRHHAMMTQVLLETFGITSTLVKSELLVDRQNLGKHVNNAVRIEGKWYLIDSTNPEPQSDNKSTRIFIRPLPEKTIDLNANVYNWDFILKNGSHRGYKSHSEMYYRIRDNVSNPTQ